MRRHFRFFNLVALILLYSLKQCKAEVSRKSCENGQTWPSNRSNSTTKLMELRKLMVQEKMYAYYLPNSDRHLTIPMPHDKRRDWLSGFTGSNGNLLITLQKASLWTDTRYTLQADNEIDCNWIIFDKNHEMEDLIKWANLTNDQILGIDFNLISADNYLKIKRTNVTLKDDENGNIIDRLWNISNGRPTEKGGLIYPLAIHYTGKSWLQKIEDVRSQMKTKADNLIVSAMDEIPYFLNIRGDVLNYVPYFPSYIILTQQTIALYVFNVTEKLANNDLTNHLNVSENGSCSSPEYCVSVKELDQFMNDLKNLKTTTWVSTMKINAAVYTNLVSNKVSIFVNVTPLQKMKSIKNEMEREAYATCSMYDSIALISLIATVDKSIRKNDGRTWTELSVAEELRKFRSQEPNFRGLSFETISAYGKNGAIIHYRPTPTTNSQLGTDNLFLLDSGGQYLGCTTDVTRTLHFGQPTAHQIEAYTRVLAGAVDTMRAIWINSLLAYPIGTLARLHLWRKGWTYAHGTGHGIGLFLNVHESPTGTESRVDNFVIGNFLSVEPGYYEENAFGIRLETIVGVEEAQIQEQNAKSNLKFLNFSPKTLVPFEPNLINITLLSNEQISWINRYHQICKETIEKFLKSRGRSDALEWLYLKTKPLPLRQFVINAASRKIEVHLFVWVVGLTYAMTHINL